MDWNQWKVRNNEPLILSGLSSRLIGPRVHDMMCFSSDVDSSKMSDLLLQKYLWFNLHYLCYLSCDIICPSIHLFICPSIGTILCTEHQCCQSSLLGYWTQSWICHHFDVSYSNGSFIPVSWYSLCWQNWEMGPKTICSMIFQKCIGPDMFSWIRHCMAEVYTLPSALLVVIFLHVNPNQH